MFTEADHSFLWFKWEAIGLIAKIVHSTFHTPFYTQLKHQSFWIQLCAASQEQAVLSGEQAGEDKKNSTEKTSRIVARL